MIHNVNFTWFYDDRNPPNSKRETPSKYFEYSLANSGKLVNCVRVLGFKKRCGSLGFDDDCGDHNDRYVNTGESIGMQFASYKL